MSSPMLEVALVLVVAAVILWGLFAVVLGPKLWQSQCWAFWVDVVVAGAFYLWLLARLPDKGWGLSDVFALLGLYVALVAAIFAVRSLWATQDAAQQAAASAKELVAQEL